MGPGWRALAIVDAVKIERHGKPFDGSTATELYARQRRHRQLGLEIRVPNCSTKRVSSTSPGAMRGPYPCEFDGCFYPGLAGFRRFSSSAISSTTSNQSPGLFW